MNLNRANITNPLTVILSGPSFSPSAGSASPSVQDSRSLTCPLLRKHFRSAMQTKPEGAREMEYLRQVKYFKHYYS